MCIYSRTRSFIFMFALGFCLFWTPDLLAKAFDCSGDVDCNFGTCGTNGTCVCNEGFINTPTSACAVKPERADFLPQFMLETFTGWGFPSGFAYQGMWEIAGIRLGWEAVTAALWGGWAGSRAYDRRHLIVREPVELLEVGGVDGTAAALQPTRCPGCGRTKALLVSAGIATFFHAAGWIAGMVFFGELYHPDPNLKKFFNKNKGEADLVVMGSHMATSARVTMQTFDESSCAYQEGCIDGLGERRLLRFDSYIYNVGDGDFVAGFEDIRPEWSSCHEHFHAPEATTYFMQQELTNSSGDTVAIRYGHKQGYCFRDTIQISGNNESKFGCGWPQGTKHFTQGISAGWADIYDGGLDCQWIDVTGLPAGTYQLTVTVNPNGTYYQDNPDNNITTIAVDIPAVDESAERTPQGKNLNAWVVKEYDE